MKKGVRVVIALFAVILAAALAVNISFLDLSPETLSEEDCQFIDKALERFEDTIGEAKVIENEAQSQFNSCENAGQNCRKLERNLKEATERSTKLAEVKAETISIYDSFCS